MLGMFLKRLEEGVVKHLGDSVRRFGCLAKRLEDLVGCLGGFVKHFDDVVRHLCKLVKRCY